MRCSKLAILSALGVLAAAPAPAAEWQYGETSIQLDSTVSVGASFRVQERDEKLVGIANGGTARSINGDDGNLNYDPGLIALAARATHEIEVEHGNIGAFTRFTYFYDLLNADKDSTDFRDLSNKAVDQVGRDIDLLDAYIYGNTEILGRRVDARLGRQVMNWGESTFIPNGINAINPVDLSALRVPGSELREGLLPVEAIDLNAQLSDNLSVEGFYQLLWHETKLDAAGTYFSTSDIASPGGNNVYLGFGSALVPDNPAFNGPTAACPLGCRVARSGTDTPKDEGQFGVALRYFAPWLNDTEFGVYGMQYHSRVPVINAHTGTLAGLLGGNFAASSRYNLEYPEDVKLGGASFSTSIGLFSVQGEYALRVDQPLQIDDVELLQAALAPGAVAAAAPGAARNATAAAFSTNQIIRRMGGISAANFTTFFDRDLKGYISRSVSSGAMTATRAFGPAFGSDQWLLLGEVGATFIHDMPDKDDLRLEGAGTYTGGNPVLAGPEGLEARKGFADRFSWGYRLTARFDFLNAIGPINLFPRVSFQHDVNGTTPSPLATYLEGRKAVSFGIGATYQQNWSADIQYTNFFGAGRYNLINDRDFVSINVKYSF